MKTSTAIIITLAIIGGGYFLMRDRPQTPSNYSQNYTPAPAENVTIEDGKQIIEIKAKGGYLPRTSIAKAGVPTVLRFNTNGTFDCSASVRIPSMGISKILPQSGNTDIDIGTPEVATLQGTCGMGMYPFSVQFQS